MFPIIRQHRWLKTRFVQEIRETSDVIRTQKENRWKSIKGFELSNPIPLSFRVWLFIGSGFVYATLLLTVTMIQAKFCC